MEGALAGGPASEGALAGGPGREGDRGGWRSVREKSSLQGQPSLSSAY